MTGDLSMQTQEAKVSQKQPWATWLEKWDLRTADGPQRFRHCCPLEFPLTMEMRDHPAVQRLTHSYMLNKDTEEWDE